MGVLCECVYVLSVVSLLVCVCVFGLSGVHVCSVCVCGVFGKCVCECACVCVCVSVCACMCV